MKKIIISIICLIGCMFSCNSYYAVQNTNDNICKVNDESILNNTYAEKISNEKKVEILVASRKEDNKLTDEERSKKRRTDIKELQDSLAEKVAKKEEGKLGPSQESINKASMATLKKEIRDLCNEEQKYINKQIDIAKKEGKDTTQLYADLKKYGSVKEETENVEINEPDTGLSNNDKDETAPSFTPELNPGTGDNFLDKLFNSASNWIGDKGEGNLGKNLSKTLKTFIMQPLFMIGNLIIFIAAIVLGLKYIWSGVEGKGLLKEELPNFVIAIMFFYLAQGIYDLVSGTLTGMILDKSSFDSIANGIFSTVGFIVNIGAIIGFIVIGIKYMIGSASEKADFKQSLIPAVVGIILIYCVNNVVQFIYKIGTSLL